MDGQTLEMRLLTVENKFPAFVEQLGALDNGFSRQMNSIATRVRELDKEIGQLQERINM